MSLRRAVVVPFLLAFLGAFALHAGLSALLVSRAVEREMTDRLVRVAAFFRDARLPATPATLAYVREAFGVDVVTRDGASTLPADASREVLSGGGAGSGRENIAGREYLVLRDGATVALIPAERIAEERTRALAPLLALGLLTAILAGGLAWTIAARVAFPIERVAADARRGGILEAPPGSPREVQDLVRAFNAMLDSSVRSERLAVAGRLAAMLAHEIRNPLSSVRMAAQIMKAQGGDAEACGRIERETQRIERAVAELLDLSRPAPLKRETVDLGALLADVAALVRPRAEHQGVRLDVDPCVQTVPADADRLQRAVWNLVLNAIQATPTGGFVRLAAGPGGRGVRIRVSDTGRGVPADLRDRLFEPFVTSKPDGVGLGLAVTKRVAEDHGGAAGFDSTPQGATFWIEIPNG